MEPVTFKPREVGWMTVLEPYQIVEKFNQFMLGLGNYYSGEITSLYKINRWHYVLYYSCIKTLATKFKVSVRSIIRELGYLDISVPGNQNRKKSLATDLRICV